MAKGVLAIVESARWAGRYGRLVWSLLRILFRGRVLGILAVIFLLLGPSIVVVRHIAGSIDQDPPLYLRYAPEVPALAQYGHLLGAKSYPMLMLPAVAAFFHDGELVAGSSLGLNGLDEVYRVLVPLLMLLIGANVLPQARALFGTLFSLPARRGTLFLIHAAALAVVCILLFGVAFGLNVAAVSLTKGYDSGILGLLVNTHILLLLYGGVFAYMGLAFAALFRRRGVALLAGMAAIVLVISILPSFRSAVYHAYYSAHEFEIRLAKLGGYLPNDPWYRTTQALTLAPGTAYTHSMFFMAYDAKYPGSRHCPDCQPWETPWTIVARMRIALAATSFGLMALGAVAFARKEAEG